MIILGVLVGFVGLEVMSIFMHKYLFHGPLWFIHQSHHEKRKGVFEKNDLFSFFFAGVGMGLILWGRTHSPFVWGTGLGVSLYGTIYFIIHDLMSHRRFYPLKTKLKWINFFVFDHRKHHQRVDKTGQGPWGLFSGL